MLSAVLVYLNALDNPFAYDDYRTVVDNPTIQDLGSVRAILWHDVARPMINVSYALDRALWGPAPFGFHLTNVLLHALNVFLLYLVVRQVASRHSMAAAPAAAWLFAVHPMMTEAVGYVSGRSEVLCATFCLLAGLSAGRWRRRGGTSWVVATIALWLAALATKEIAIMFPFVLLVYERLAPASDDITQRRWSIALPLSLMAAAVLAGLVRIAVLTRLEAHAGAAGVQWSFIPLAFDVAARYVRLLVLPVGQTVFHTVWPLAWADARALAGLAIVATMAGAAWRLKRIEWGATIGIAWFLLLLIPSSVLILLDRGEPMAEHRVYLASAGLFLAVGIGIGRAWTTLAGASTALRGIAGAASVVALLSLAALAVVRNAVWEDPVRLWQEAVDKSPAHYRPRLLLGEALQHARRPGEALQHFRTAISLRPEEPTGYIKLGQCLAVMGRLDEAADVLERLRVRDPQSTLALNGLGTVAMLGGQTTRAREYFLQTIARDPRNVPARQSLVVMNELEPANPRESLRLCQEIQRIAPWTPGNDDCIRRNQTRLAARRAGQ